jgi:pyroglutamyl-peptidase
VDELLLTGFGPFAEHATNPSGEVAQRLDGERIGRLRVRGVLLDVAWARAGTALCAAVHAVRPAAVLALGVAPSPALRIERSAENRDRPRIPDVDGVLRAPGPIRADGPATIPTRLPWGPILRDLESAGFEAVASDDAGGYLCNHVFYLLLDGLADDGPAGFVHVPALGEAWPLARLVYAIRCVVTTIDRERRPLRAGSG